MTKGCLLTGAAGFLGRYLLRNLLAADVPLAVLVRPGKFQPARDRIEAVLSFWEAQGHHLPHPTVFEGDLNRDDLGLDADARTWIARHCDSVLHSAASMVFERTPHAPREGSPHAEREEYAEPHRTNVEGTGHLVDFCRRAGIRRFHHVSTAFLCGLRQGRVLESELDEGQTLGNVYEESKLAAEKLLHSAGVFDELTIYRPSSIVGDSRTGMTSNYHGFYLPLQLAHAFSSAVPPEVMEERFTAVLGLTGQEGKNLVPVDWLAAAIAYLFTHPEHHGRVYHLTHPRPTTVRLIQSVIAEAIRRYSKRPAATRIGDRDLAAYERLFQGQMNVYRSHWRDDPIFDRTNTDAAFPHLQPPDMDHDLLLRVARYAIENNFSAPRQPAVERRPGARDGAEPVLAPPGGSDGAAKAERVDLMADTTDVTNIPLAIVGMACRLPGADNLDEYWQLIIEGRSAVGEMPADRLDQELYFDPRQGVRGKTYSKLAAVLRSREFDRAACPIPASLEGSVDLAHLLMCEVAAAACRHAGYDPFHLPLRNTGVYIGHAQGSELGGQYTYATCIEEAAHFLDEIDDFARLPRDTQQAAIDQLVATVRGKLPDQGRQTRDVAASMIAGTIAKAFGLSGPFLALNAACASSLQALLIAARALQLGRVDMAIVGGGSDCKGDSMVLFSHAQTLSAEGTRPFDADADGLILGEGYVCVVVKKLDRAIADGDRICAVIRGLGVSSDGKGKSLWAPRKEGQIKAMERAYAGGLDMADLDYLEAHATATQLGDATELSAVSELLQGRLPPGKKVAVTSVKANIGHTLESAGLAGLIKTVLCMQHGMFPPAINVRQLNPKIDWPNVPVYVPLKPEPWPQPAGGRPRRAGVNAFGIGGLNMHVVLDEFIPAAQSKIQNPKSEISTDAQAVAVVGIGCIFPGAANVAEFGELLLSGRDAKTPAPPDRWRADLAHRPSPPQPFCSPVTHGGYITDFRYDWRTHKIPPKQIEQADPLQFMLLDAADQALRDAGYDKRAYDRTRTGVVAGTEFGGDFAFQLQMALRLPELGRMLRAILGNLGVDAQQAATIDDKFAETLLKHWPALVDESGSFSTSALASRINKTWDLMGGAAAIDAGENSALAALSIAIDQLLAGDCDLMVCAAGQRRMSLPAYEGLALAGTLATRDDPAAPFDAAAHGYLPGEGVGVLLLKRLADARRDGDPIRAIIRGVAAAHAESPATAIRTAAERSLGAPIAKASDVTALVADGFALPQADADAIRTLAAVYGAEPRRQPLRLSSIIGQMGHLAGASGMASLIKAILEVERGEVAATVNLRTPSPAFAESGIVTAATARAPLGTTPDGRRLAAVVSCGRGLAHHAIIERGAKVEVVAGTVAPQTQVLSGSPTTAWCPPRPLPSDLGTVQQRAEAVVGEGLGVRVVGSAQATPLPTTASAWRICRLGAASPDQLTVRLADIDAEALWAASTTSRFTAADRVRLAIVADSAATLRQKIQTAAKQFQNASAAPVLQQQGIFYRKLGNARPRIAMLFPGQGSQYAGMVQSLVEAEPAAAAAMQRFDAVMTQAGCPTFAQLAWGDGAALGRDVFLTQAAMLAADTIVLAALTARGIRPDVVAGHSYGEYVALLAAGAWDIAGALRATRARCEAIAASPTARGTMLAIQAAPQAVEDLIARLHVPAYVANYNAPDQVVVGGAEETLAALSAEAERESHKTRRLAVPCAFHTPLLKDAAARLAAALAGIEIAAPRVPIVSAVSGRCARTPTEIRANLVAHMTQPVRYSDLVEKLVNECETALVEVGPQQVLTGLHRRILQTRDVIMVGSDNPKRPGVETLLGVEAMLDCAGALDAEPASTQPPAATVAAAKPQQEILFFDATARRREKMRHTSEGRPAKATADAGSVVAERSRVVDDARKQSPAVAVSDTLPLAPTNGSANAPPAATPPKQLAPLGAELEPFLINFVVEQTGYPPEVVELDADLEADLGIDSIKKAQLFGELREYFDVTPSEDLTLDDFPTLRHVVKFLRGEPVKRAAPAEQPAAMPVADGQLFESVEEQGEFEPSFPVPSEREQPSYATSGMGNGHALADGFERPAYVAQDSFAAAAHPETLAASTAVVERPLKPAPSGDRDESPLATRKPGPVGDELEPFLINFVVEQTGYPPEVVELDADLEADLGIDSIKKAQLFGELREYFDVTPSEDLTLDDFPTLRHVVKFLRGEPIKRSTPAAAPTEAGSAIISNGNGDASPAAAHNGHALTTTGTPYALGLAQGEQYRAEIRQLLRRLADLPEAALAELQLPPEAVEDPSGGLDNDALDELQGIADAVEIPLANVTAINHVLKAISEAASLPQPCADDALATVGQRLDQLAAESRLVAGLRDCLVPIVRTGAQREIALVGAIRGSGVPGALRAERVRPSGSDSGAWSLRCQGPSHPDQLVTDLQPTADDLADDNQKRFSLRFVMRMIDAPFAPDCPAAPAWNGPALVIGDNPAADALRRRLRASGAEVRDLAIADDLDATLAAFDALWQQGPLPHLFLMGERDLDPTDLRDEAAWQRRRYRRVHAPYFICQRWTQRAVEADLMGRCTVVAATALGGDFGFSGRVTAPEGGALTGLIKALCIELYVLRNFKGLIVKAIDAPDDEPVELLAENIVRELGSGKLDYEVAFVRGARQLQNAIAEPAVLTPDAGIRRGAVWVVSGGARGITAACALELGRRFGLKLHLLGTSSPPSIDPSWRNLSDEGLKTLKSSIMIRGRQAGETPDKAWAAVEKAIEMDRALRAYAEEGVAAVYHRCDVADRAALSAVLDDIRRSDGPIDGILHGAGVERAARFERKGRDDVHATLGAKLDGAYHLMTLTLQDPVRHFIGFGSIGGRLGSNGQTDYCLASDMLCKLAAWYRTLRPECRAVGFHWHPWDEIGMAARPHTRATFEISQGPGLMPSREGIRHLLRELYAGVPRTEVMITDWGYYAQFYVHQKRSFDIAPKKAGPSRRDGPGTGNDSTATSDAHRDVVGAGTESSLRSQQPSPPAPLPRPLHDAVAGRRDHQEAVAGEGSHATVAQRHIPRMVDAPLPVGTSDLRLDGPALILGDNAAAAALARRLEATGTRVHCLAGDDPDAAIAEFDRHWAEGPVRHLFLFTARDDDAATWHDRDAWQRRRARGVIVPYLVAQRWMQRLEALPEGQSATLAAVTSLGGDFGLSHTALAPEGGMLCGLVKSVHVENVRSPRHRLRLKVIDAPADAPPDAVAEALCRELAAASPEIEVGWSPGRRRVVRSFVEPVDALPQADLPRGGVWVVTGGGRGITAAAALELGRRYGLRLHLIGKSPLPKADAPWRGCSEAEMKMLKASIVHAAVAAGRSPEEDWLRIKKDIEIYQSLEAFRAAGVTCTYHACDVADWDALARTLDDIRRDGPIGGIIHGAGFGRPGRLAQKDRNVLERTVSAKVDGAVALMALTASDPLRWFVGFGSLSGRFGGNGLSDYAGANDMLAKLIDGFRRPGCAAACLHWQTWDAVGMATLADGMAINKGVLQMAFIPPAEGVEHLDRELRAGLPASEVIITDGHFEQTFYPDHAVGPACRAGLRAASHPADGIYQRPLIESITTTAAGQRSACVRFDPATDPFLVQHRLRGKPFLPAVIALETIAEAAALADPTRQIVALRDVEIVNGLLFQGDEPIEVAVSIAPAGAGFACTLTSCQRDRKGRLIDAQRPHVRGLVELGTSPAAIAATPPGEPPLGWTPARYADDGLMYHGPALRCLTDVAYQYDGGFGRIIAPPLDELAGPRPTAGWLLPSAVLDACLYACGGFTFFQFGGQIEVPYNFERLTWTRQPRPGETCMLRLWFRGRDERYSRFDFTLFGDDGQPLVEARGYRTVRLMQGGQ